MYGTTISNCPTHLCSLHPDSMKVSDEPPGNDLPSPVTKPPKQFSSLWMHNWYRSNFRDPDATCHGVVAEDICRPTRIPLWPQYASPGYSYPTYPILTSLEAREFFKNNTVDGTNIWSRLGHKVTICLATPNGWETSQQVRLYFPSMTIICIDNDT